MIPNDWAVECWGIVVFVISGGNDRHWWFSNDKVRMQNSVLREVVGPALSDRRWFFRREALRDGAVPERELANSLMLYVKLDRARSSVEEELRPPCDELERHGHRVHQVRLWDGCFGPGYGGAIGHAALREFCCDATATFLRDASSVGAHEVAREWSREGTACAAGVLHWLYWITAAGDHDFIRRLAGAISDMEAAYADMKRARDAIIARHRNWDRSRDCRITIFNKCLNVLKSTQIGLVDRLSYEHLECAGCPPLPVRVDVERADLEEYRRYLQFAFINLMQCALESSFRDFLRHIAPGSCSEARDPSFLNIYRCLLKRLELGGRWEPILDIWRLLRNTVHNNGIYAPSSRKDEEVTFGGQTYRFVDGTRPDFVNWGLILKLTRSTVEMMVAVVSSDEITRVPAIADSSA